jgi:hypothetical protein
VTDPINTTLKFTPVSSHQATWTIDSDRQKAPAPGPTSEDPSQTSFTYSLSLQSSQEPFVKVTLRLPTGTNSWDVYEYAPNETATMKVVLPDAKERITVASIQITNFTKTQLSLSVKNYNPGTISINGSNQIPIGVRLTVIHDSISYTSPDPQIILVPRDQ